MPYTHFLKRTVSGLIKRYEYDRAEHPFDTADWTVPSSGASIALSGGALRVTVSAGVYNRMVTADGTSASEQLVHARLDVVSGGMTGGLGALVSDRNSLTGIEGSIALGWSGGRYHNDWSGGGPTSISTTPGINRGTAENAFSLWADGTNAAYWDFTGGAGESGAQVNNPHTGEAGVFGSAGATTSMDVKRFFVMSGRYITVSGLTSGQIGKLIFWGGNIATIDSDTAGAPGTISLDCLTADFPFVTLAIYESDGTTLVAAVEDVFGGDTFELWNPVSEALTIINPGAESALGAEWTLSGSYPTISRSCTTAYEGSCHFAMSAGVGGNKTAYQDIAIPASWEAGIDAGIHRIDHLFHTYGTGQGGAGGISWLEFFDVTPASISDALMPMMNQVSNSTWAPRGVTMVVPAGTRYVRIWMRATVTVNAGKGIDAHYLTLLSGDSQPYQPAISSVSPLTGETGTVNGTAYSHNAGRAHAGSQVQVRLQGASDWSSLVTDTGEVAASESVPIDGMEILKWHEARLRYKDEDDVWSPWSPTFAFQTTDVADSGIPFEWADWAQIWNIEQAVYFGAFVGPGGWHKINFTPDASCPNPYNGRVASFGRLLGPPSALVYTPSPNRGADVKCRIGWWSSAGGYSWERYYDCELARAGLVASACGSATANSPQAAHDVWNPYEWTLSDDFQGVFAYIEPQFAWPYNNCLVPDGPYWGDAPAWLYVDVYHAGELAKRWKVELPERIVFSSYSSTGSCCHYPWWGLRLKMWHDYGADAEGKTHRIQVSYTKPSDDVGTASLPSDATPWTHDITWVGGHDETSPGDGDGGLRCGYSGYGGDRWTGANTTNTYGATVYRDFLLDIIEEAFCGAPCDADYIPELTPIIPPPPVPAPFSAPCPPVEEGEFQSVYLGGKDEGSLFQFGGYEVEAGRNVVAKIQPNAVAPAGYGGECHFKSVVVAVEHIGDISIGLTPILTGEVLTAYTQEELFVGPGDRVQIRRYEVPLYRGFEDGVVEGTVDDRFKYGLRGAFFSVLIEVVDICGLGLNLSGIEIDYDTARESQATGIVYTEHLLRTPAFQSTGGAFIGGAPGLLKAGIGTTDDGAVAQARVVTNPVAPQGIGGECVFNRIPITVTRWNAADMDLFVTPIIDGHEMASVTVHYKATTAPVTEVTEVQITEYYTREDGIEQFRYRPRGAWLAVKIETGDGLQDWLTIEGVELDYDVARESMTKDVR